MRGAAGNGLGFRGESTEEGGDVAAGASWNESKVEIAGVTLHLARAGSGRPVLVLHHDIGSPEQLDFYDALASRLLTSSCRIIRATASRSGPQWLRSGVRDVAVMYQWLLFWISAVERPSLVGLGFGGWIAAEMAAMAPDRLHRLALVGAMGLKPPEGDILDQAIISYLDYARAGFHDQHGVRPHLRRCVDRSTGRGLGHLPPRCASRIAWKLYMYSQTFAASVGWGEAFARRLRRPGRRRQDRAAQRGRTLCRDLAKRPV